MSDSAMDHWNAGLSFTGKRVAPRVGKQTSNTSARMNRSLLLTVFVIFLFGTLGSGVLRYYTASVGLPLLAYLPKLVLIFGVVVSLLSSRGKLSRAQFHVFVLLLGATVVGVGVVGVAQAIFGLWSMVPFIFGLCAARYLNLPSWSRLAGVLLLIVTVGIIAGEFLRLPWSGSSVELFGQSVQVARSWTIGGIDRIGGFARASSNAAVQTMILALIVKVYGKRRIVIYALWILAGFTITLTTTKTVMAAWLALTFCFTIGELHVPEHMRRRMWKALIAGVMIVSIVLPLLAYVSRSHSGFVTDAVAQSALAGSFYARLTDTWPGSLQLLDGGHYLLWLIGRGVGGIGAAQKYFEYLRYMPADNMFVFLFVTFGLPCTLVLGSFSRRVFNQQRNWLYDDPIIAPGLLFVMIFGITMAVFDMPLISLFLGVLLSDARSNYYSLHSFS